MGQGRKLWGPLNSGLRGLVRRGGEWGGGDTGPAVGPAGKELVNVPLTWAPSCSGLYNQEQLVLVWSAAAGTVGTVAFQAPSPPPGREQILVEMAGSRAETLDCGAGSRMVALPRGPGLAGQVVQDGGRGKPRVK